jgi:hypothetical protein
MKLSDSKKAISEIPNYWVVAVTTRAVSLLLERLL